MSLLSPVSPDPAANAGPASPADADPGIPLQRHRPFSRANLVQTIAGGYLPLILATLVVFLPLLWMVLSSFKQPGEIITMDLKILPESLNLENYNIAMTTVPFAQFFVNSLIVTSVGATIKVLLAILTAYALVFVRFPYKNVIFVLILVALMVPPQVSILPNYILIAGMGGKNTLWGIILPGLGTAFGTFLLRQHFMTLPALHPGIGRDRRRRPLAPPLADRGAGLRPLDRHGGPRRRRERMERLHLAAHHHGPSRDDDAARGPDPAAELRGQRLRLGHPDGRRRAGDRAHPAGLRGAAALHRGRPHPGQRHRVTPPAESSLSPQFITPFNESASSRGSTMALNLDRRHFLGLAGAGAGAAALAACGGPSTAGTAAATGAADIDFSGVKPAASIDFWSNHPGKSQDVEKAIIEKFHAKFPDIKVNLVTAGANYEEIAQKFQTSQAAKSGLPGPCGALRRLVVPVLHQRQHHRRWTA